jgi:hypothetical protein
LVLVYENLPLGTTDATVVAVCERLRLTELASLDHHHFSAIRPRHAERLRLLPDWAASPGEGSQVSTTSCHPRPGAAIAAASNLVIQATA